MDKYTGKKIINKSFHYKNPILFNTLIKNEILNPSELSSKYINIKEKHKKILKVNKLITNSSPVIILDEINKPEISISGDKNINIFDITSIKSSLNTEINDRKSLINDEQKNNDPLSIENLSLQSKNKISIDNSKEVSTEINDLRSLITNDLKSKAFFSVKKNKFEPFQETNIKLSNINNSIKKDRKYNSIYRKKLLQKFENIKNKQVFIDIYYIIINDIGTNFSSNRNGIFINMNILSDNCIENLIDYITKYNDNMKIDSLLESRCKIYKFDDIEILSELGHKLTNQEKTILKKIKTTN